MKLSVVVPTLNGRDRLAGVLDALGAHAPDAEVVVVNGPSTDGTSGMVRDHDDADVLVELGERNINASRNAGIASATGDVIAFVGQRSEIDDGWMDAVRERIRDGADAVTGPVHRSVEGGVTTEKPERVHIADRSVTYFDGGNVAFTRDALDVLDGFDEYLDTGGARDAAHRLAGMGRRVAWDPAMTVLRGDGCDIADRTAGADDGDSVWGLKYRSLAYRLAKNYGPRPTVATRTLRHAARDALAALRDVVTGDETPTNWLGTGRAVVPNIARGVADGLRARAADRSATRNPNGVSNRGDRAVARYDWR